VDPAWGILIGVVLSGTLATVVGLATARLSGYFITVATMLVGVTFERFLVQAGPLTGGPTGLGFQKTLFGISVSRIDLLIGGAILVWLVAMALQNLRKSSTGKSLLLLSRSWAAAESVGLETRKARIVGLCLGACIASLGGSLLALSSGFVLPESYNMMISFLVIFIPLIGGGQSAWGSLIGAAVVCYVLQVAHQFGPSQLLFGLTTLAVVLLVPGGILGGLHSVARLVSSRRKTRAVDSFEYQSPDRDTAPVPVAEQAISGKQPALGKILLTVTNVSKSYGGVQALSGVSFEVKQGEVLGIVGPNGAGKSTLIDIVTGVQEPDSGKVILDGNEMTEGPAARAHRGMSRTFQHPLLAQSLTVLENVHLGYLREKAPRSWVGLFTWFLKNMAVGQRGESGEVTGEGRRIEGEFTLLAKYLHTMVTDVSHGTEKLAESVRALISSPPLLIMDEPFAGLDASAIEAIGHTLRRFSFQGLAAVIVDHNVDVLRDMCDRMVVLNYGQVIAVGKPQDVLDDQAVRRAYFGDD
jgi:branched-chain amino acid transport system permease protein